MRPISFRTSILAAFVGAVLAACASPSASPPDDADAQAQDELRSTAKNDLASGDEKKVLTMLDDHCGDAWCEGDYDWQFKKLRCTYADASCTLTLFITDPAVDGQPARYFWRSCKMTGLPAWTSLVETFPNGYEDLTDGFFGKVSDCIDRLESRLPPR